MVTLVRSKVAQLFATPTRINAVTSYMSLCLSMVFGILAVKLAYIYLDKEQYGIWSLFAKAIGMLVLLDFGVSSGASRMLAEPMRTGNRQQLDTWWTTIVLVLLCQGFLLFVCGMATEALVLSHTKIPPQFASQASLLWKVMVITSAVKMPFQAYAGILFCQNRFYHMNLSVMVGAVANMLLFFIFLKLGYGLNAYSAAVTIQITLMIIYWVISVRVSKVEVSIRPSLFEWGNVKRLFGYSGSLFLYAVGSSLTLVSQNFVVEAYLGYAAVGAFNIATNAYVVLGQLLLRTQEAKVPGWWQLYDSGGGDVIVEDRRRLMNWFVPLIVFSGAGLMVFNRSFVTIITDSSNNMGRGFDALLAFSLVATQYIKSTHFIFPLVQRTWRWALVSLGDSLLQVLLGMIFIRFWGAAGLLVGSLVSMLLVSLPFSMWAAPSLLHSPFREFFRKALPDVFLAIAILAVFTGVVMKAGDYNGWFPLPLEWVGAVGILALAGWTALRFTGSMGRKDTAA